MSFARHFALSAAVCGLLAPLAPGQGDADLPRLPNPVVVAERLAGQLVRLDGETGELVDYALDPETAIEHFLLFYTAGWSPSSQKFAPALVRFYEEQKAAGASFEVVMVSVDDSEKEMLAHMKDIKMPWPAVRFGSVEVGASAPQDESDENEDEDQPAPPPNPLEFIEQAAGRGVPCVVVMDSRGLILAHSYKRRKEYLGAEEPLEEFSKLLAQAAEKRAAREAEAKGGEGAEE